MSWTGHELVLGRERYKISRLLTSGAEEAGDLYRALGSGGFVYLGLPSEGESPLDTADAAHIQGLTRRGAFLPVYKVAWHDAAPVFIFPKLRLTPFHQAQPSLPRTPEWVAAEIARLAEAVDRCHAELDSAALLRSGRVVAVEPGSHLALVPPMRLDRDPAAHQADVRELGLLAGSLLTGATQTADALSVAGLEPSIRDILLRACRDSYGRASEFAGELASVLRASGQPTASESDAALVAESAASLSPEPDLALPVATEGIEGEGARPHVLRLAWPWGALAAIALIIVLLLTAWRDEADLWLTGLLGRSTTVPTIVAPTATLRPTFTPSQAFTWTPSATAVSAAKPITSTGASTPAPTRPPTVLSSTPGASPSVTPASTRLPSSTPSVVPPTPTRSPTAILPTPRPPTPSPVPPAPPVQNYPAPVLLAPAADFTASGPATFAWRWDGPALTANQAFEVRLWKEDQPDHYGAAEPVNGTSAIINVREAYGVQRGGSGRYFWTVAVVQRNPYQRIGPEADPRPIAVSVGGLPTIAPPR